MFETRLEGHRGNSLSRTTRASSQCRVHALLRLSFLVHSSPLGPAMYGMAEFNNLKRGAK